MFVRYSNICHRQNVECEQRHCSQQIKNNIPIANGEIKDGFQVMSRTNSGLPVIWTWDVMSEVFLDCGIHLVFNSVMANSVEVVDQFMKENNLGSEFIK